MFERFTEEARQVVVAAQEEARGLAHHYIGTEHLLLGLAADPESAAGSALRALGVERQWLRGAVEQAIGRGEGLDAEALATIGIDLDLVRRRVEDAFGEGALERACGPRGRCARRGPAGAIPFTPRSKKVLELALREAVQRRDGSIGPEHILLGIEREARGVACRLLRGRGVAADDVRGALATELGRRRVAG